MLSPDLATPQLYISLKRSLRPNDPQLVFRILDYMNYAIQLGGPGFPVVQHSNPHVKILCHILAHSPAQQSAGLTLWTDRIRLVFQKLRDEELLRNKIVTLGWKEKALSSLAARQGLMTIDFKLVKLLWEQLEEAHQMGLAMRAADQVLESWLEEA